MDEGEAWKPRVGDIVETAVFVGRERIPMGRGRIVAVQSGYCEVDIGVGAPWVTFQRTTWLQLLRRTVSDSDIDALV